MKKRQFTKAHRLAISNSVKKSMTPAHRAFISQKTKEAMSRPDVRAKLATPERNAKISKSLMGHVLSKQTRAKISLTVSKLLTGKSYEERLGKEKAVLARKRQSAAKLGNRNSNGWPVLGYFDSKKNKKKIPYRSSYEVLAFQMLEKDVKVVSYEYETMRVNYINAKGEHKTTVPDLLVYLSSGDKEVIEVKSQRAILHDNNTTLKINAAKKYAEDNGMSYLVWTEKELGINRKIT